MLRLVLDQTDPLYRHLGDDPVRPGIPHHVRITGNREVWALTDGGRPLAMTCVAYTGDIPATEDDLNWGGHRAAVFYTIWSYSRGSGRELIIGAMGAIGAARPWVREWVTLSPPGETARRFHLANGAQLWRDNGSTVNYRYSRTS